MKCCTLPSGEIHKSKVTKVHKDKSEMHKGSGTGSKLARAAHKCKGKHGVKFRKCVKAKIKKLKK